MRTRLPFLLALAALPAATPSHATLTEGWTGTGGVPDAAYGISVALAGDLNDDGYDDIVVGARGDQVLPGRVDVHLGSAAGVQPLPVLTLHSLTPEMYGEHVAGAGDVNGDGHDDVLISAPQYGNGQTWEGRVDLHLGTPGGLSAVPVWSFEADQEYSGMRFARGVDDVDGDGFADFAIGAPWVDAGNGRAWIFRGNATAEPTVLWEGSLAHGGGFGYDVARAGDLNGDGYDDVAIGSWWGEFAAVLLGAASPPYFVVPVLSPTATTQARFGSVVAGAGDVNGDGFDDLLVGAPEDSVLSAEAGRAYVFRGHANGFETAPSRSISPRADRSAFGRRIAGAGDLNGDGFDDVVIAAPQGGAGQSVEGQVYAYAGSASGLGTSAFWIAASGAPAAFLGTGLDAGGDVNGDGYADVIAGAPFFGEQGIDDEGKAWVWHGGPPVTAVPSSPVPVPGGARLTLRALPTPFRGSTSLEFAIPRAGPAEIELYDAAGRSIVELLRGSHPAGPVRVDWDGRDRDGDAVAAGVYFAVARAAGASSVTRIVRVR